MTRKIQKEDLLKEAQRLYNLLGKAPTLTDLRNIGKYSEDPFRNVFGSWTEALRCAGIAPSPIGTSISESELLYDLRRVSNLINKKPTTAEYRKHGKYSPSCYYYHWGGWALALKDIGFPIVEKPEWSIDQLAPLDGAWLSGLTDGEGCFILSRYNRKYGGHSYVCGYAIGFRDDDYDVLEIIKDLWNVTYKINHQRKPNENGTANLSIQDTLTLKFKVVPTFEKYPLRSKKRRDFELWKKAVEIKYQKYAEGRAQKPYLFAEMERLNTLWLGLKKNKLYVDNFPNL